VLSAKTAKYMSLKNLYKYGISFCVQTYVGEQTDSDYLDTDDGKEYVPVFKHIRLIHIVTDSGSILVINTDRIIPKGQFFLACCS